mgnify:CR=1 FL=1
MENYKEKHQEIRQGVRALCSQFSAEYHRKVDAEKGYLEEINRAGGNSGACHGQM